MPSSSRVAGTAWHTLQVYAPTSAVHMHVSSKQVSPSGQVPLAQIPPQPSAPPHAALAQFGTQAHSPLVSHVVPVWQTVHWPPPTPHAVGSDVPSTQTLPEQHPAHVVESQVHAPSKHCWPGAQAPSWQVPPQPSSPPQAWPAQLGAQLPSSGMHTFASLPVPQLSPLAHDPQSTKPPHPSARRPQSFPAQALSLGTQVGSTPASAVTPGVQMHARNDPDGPHTWTPADASQSHAWV